MSALLLLLACGEPKSLDTASATTDTTESSSASTTLPNTATTSTTETPTTSTTSSTSTSGTPTTSTTGSTSTTTEVDVLEPGITTWIFEQEIDGVWVDRPVHVQAPVTLDPGARYPVLFSFHGNGGRATPFLSSLEAYVNDGRFVGVYPQGHLESWNTGQVDLTADDVAFMEQILERLSAMEQLDLDRLYAQGFSNGAGMSHLVGMRSLGFRAIAPQATALHVGDLPTADTAPLAVIQLHGVEDPICPYDGGRGAGGLDFLPAEESAATWAAHNGCDPVADEVRTAEGNLRIAYTGCPAGAEVVHYRLENCGAEGPPAPCMHGWPDTIEGGVQELILEFFESQG